MNMSEVSSEAVVVAVTPKVKSNYFKWTSEMEKQLAKAVCANKAHMKSKNVGETYEVKYDRVISDLWNRKMFNEQGVKQSWTTIQAKFRSLCEKFRSTHGYGDAGARVNVSALPSMDDLSEMDDLLHHMCKQIATQLEETDAKKKTKTQKKKTVSSITDAIVNGEGKAGLLKVSEEIQSSGVDIVSSSTSNFIKGITSVTCEPKNRKRKISKEELDGEDLMLSFATQFRRDDADEAARMESLHDRIRQSGEDTTSAIEAGNREAAKSSLLLIAAIAGLASALKNQ